MSSCSDISGVELKAQLLIQKKSMDQQSNVLQLINSVTETGKDAQRVSDGVRGKLLDVIA